MVKDYAKDREKKMKKINKEIGSIGEGLYKPQRDVKIAPWKGSWEIAEMMLERQEETIALLIEIRDLLKNDGEASQKKAPGKTTKKTPPKTTKKTSRKNAGILKKVENADFNTLRSMCKDAGIKAVGKKDELKKKLIKHYT